MVAECDNRANEIWLWLERHWVRWGENVALSKNVNHYGPWTGFRIITSKNVKHHGPWTGFRIITSKNVNHYGPWTGFRIITSKNVNHYGPWTGFRIITWQPSIDGASSIRNPGRRCATLNVETLESPQVSSTCVSKHPPYLHTITNV